MRSVGSRDGLLQPHGSLWQPYGDTVPQLGQGIRDSVGRGVTRQSATASSQTPITAWLPAISPKSSASARRGSDPSRPCVTRRVPRTKVPRQQTDLAGRTHPRAGPGQPRTTLELDGLRRRQRPPPSCLPRRILRYHGHDPPVWLGTDPPAGDRCRAPRPLEDHHLPRRLPPDRALRPRWSSQVFTKIKSELRRREPRTIVALGNAFDESLDWITPTDTRHYFQHAGYSPG